MPPPLPEPSRAQGRSSGDLPFGPLPARADRPLAEPSTPSLTRPVGLSGSDTEPRTDADADSHAHGAGKHSQDADARDADARDTDARDTDPRAHGADAGEPADLGQRDDRRDTREHEPETSSEIEIAIDRGDSDDDVHFGIAARALGVSRKTVERMVKRGQLGRGPSGAQATVSKRALVSAMEQRRRDVRQVTRAEVEADAGDAQWTTPLSQDATADVQELLGPMLEPLIGQFVAAHSRAAVLEAQLDAIKSHAARERLRDELLFTLATERWWRRRKARRAALRHYILGEEPRPPDSR